MAFRVIRDEEIRKFGDDLSYEEADRFIKAFTRITKGVDSKSSLAIFYQKLVNAASNWFNVQEKQVQESLELTLKEFQKEFLQDKVKKLFSEIQDKNEGGYPFFFRIMLIFKESGVNLTEEEAVMLFISKLESSYKTEIDNFGIVDFKTLKDKLRLSDLLRERNNNRAQKGNVDKYINDEIKTKRIRHRPRCRNCGIRGHKREKCEKKLRFLVKREKESILKSSILHKDNDEIAFVLL